MVSAGTLSTHPPSGPTTPLLQGRGYSPPGPADACYFPSPPPDRCPLEPLRTPSCRDMGATLGPSDACYFPYAVVEVKLQAEPPAWVQGLLQTGEWGEAQFGCRLSRRGAGPAVDG